MPPENPLRVVTFKVVFALAVWLGWLERPLVYQKVTSLTPGKGTYLGCTDTVLVLSLNQ